MSRLWRAPAKVNLTLHVVGRRSDGWHELDSVVAFTGCGDWLRFEPGERLSLAVAGPTGGAAGPTDDNLVLRAARALAERAPGIRLGRFHLQKSLPVAAGLGGGSSDAAAALRALAYENGIAADDERLWAAARAVGADVSVCLAARACVMTGLGERLSPPLATPPLFAVLANPGAPVATPAVFAGLGLAKGEAGQPVAAMRLGERDRSSFIAALESGRNDLQQSAIAIAPVIAETLAALARTAGAKLVRMSGSGATCFALYENRHAAAAAGASLRRAYPDWWVRVTLLR
ncbi:MAG: 4-(cytidine 5'-diphospho)-2-C-methyl-D-erythritol kinase [Hyphomicrobiales bacterium]|nr:4-(cytidine 5'-diphospho)-2-C-methyl-D-erythritol kinase [Hyphomicrobiales bacterium]